MRGSVLYLISFLLVCNAYSQEFSAKDFLFASAVPSKKLESYLTRNHFLPGGSRVQDGNQVNIYRFLKPQKNKRKKDTLNIRRTIEIFRTKNNFSFTYITSLKNEFDESLLELKESGFFCGNEKDSTGILFQRKNITVLANTIKEADDILYSFVINQQELPLPETIQFAEDLLQFYSHEYLVSVFGQSNVIKDLYYFSEKDVAKCSVLFPKTSRQAVFIWEDNVNLCKPAYLIIGGNMNTNTISNYDGVIGENVWNSKAGIYSGMSLNSLMALNGNSFKFYGKNSPSPYMIVPENTGSINFKTNRVV
ncbi:MAG TPA: hypothetical protein VFT15_11045, partial [Chitinophagaceae bacterium]|nr:hypothetical protein [Chitinophagaceae bacterium]